MEIEFFEKVIIKKLFSDKNIKEKVLPFLQAELFDEFNHKEIVKSIMFFEEKFQKFPSIEDLKLHISDNKVFDSFKGIVKLDISEFSEESLLGEVQDFFKRKMIWSAIAEGAEKLKEDDLDILASLPDELRTALSFSFDTNIGLDLMSDADRMFDHLHLKDKIVPTGLTDLDKNIEGGLHEKSISIILAETNLGKTLIKCSLAANALLHNKNVLYVTFEMSEEKIAERILQNIFDMQKDEMMKLTKEKFRLKYKSIHDKLKKHLFIKEYPTKTANTNSLRNLLKELEMKKKFKPNVMFVDYLGIMNPIHRLKSDNTYTEGKKIVEELRGLAVERSIPIMSSVQANRNAYSSSDLDLKNISDSIGTAQGADVIIGASQPDGYKEQGKILLMILKNRYGMNGIKFNVNVDYTKMKIFDSDDNKDYKTPSFKSEDQKTIDKEEKATDFIKSSLKKNRDKKRKNIINFE